MTDWPVELAGVTETVVTTLGPSGTWNAAALGVHAGPPATARTWGNTRTSRNFAREGAGVVQFLDDPVAFVEAAVTIVEPPEAVLEAAAAWTRVRVERRGERAGTNWTEWTLHPEETTIRRETVPAISRGLGAVVEASVAVSRLGVPAYEADHLRERIEWCEAVVERTGGEREREAMAILRDHDGS